MHISTNDETFHDLADICATKMIIGTSTHHGTLVNRLRAPSSSHDKGWVSGSRTKRNPGLTKRNPVSRDAVTSRDCGIAPQALCNVSSDGKGNSHHADDSPLRLFKVKRALPPLELHHSVKPRKLKIPSYAAIVFIFLCQGDPRQHGASFFKFAYLEN